MDKLIFTHKFVVGDWSNDGHGKSTILTFKCTHPEHEIHRLYLQAAEKSGIWMHEDLEYGDMSDRIALFQDYEDNILTHEHITRLQDLGVDMQKMAEIVSKLDVAEYEDDDRMNVSYYGTPEIVLEIFLTMTKTQDQEFSYQIIQDYIKPINGFWHKTFNHSFGYGVFH